MEAEPVFPILVNPNRELMNTKRLNRFGKVVLKTLRKEGFDVPTKKHWIDYREYMRISSQIDPSNGMPLLVQKQNNYMMDYLMHISGIEKSKSKFTDKEFPPATVHWREMDESILQRMDSGYSSL